mmetsp:Transcript_11664/g.28559  ORF Transcript_11664/g.28559 Transcript_11664/m.28559 type:complete len:188 (+) Transcript_11664:3-566(+)
MAGYGREMLIFLAVAALMWVPAWRYRSPTFFLVGLGIMGQHGAQIFFSFEILNAEAVFAGGVVLTAAAAFHRAIGTLFCGMYSLISKHKFMWLTPLIFPPGGNLLVEREVTKLAASVLAFALVMLLDRRYRFMPLREVMRRRGVWPYKRQEEGKDKGGYALLAKAEEEPRVGMRAHGDALAGVSHRV